MKLTITPEEAEIIEVSLRKRNECTLNDELTLWREFLRSIGHILISGRTIEFDLSRTQLWFLRDNIDPDVGVGINGLDIIKKIYELLLADTLIDNYEVVEDGKFPLEVIYADKDNSKGKTKNRAKGRPRQKIKSEATLPRSKKKNN